MRDALEFGVASKDELPRIIDIKWAMFLESGHADLLAPNAKASVLEDYQRLYEANEARHFVTRASGRIVASVGAFVKSDLPFRYFRSGTYGFIGDVYTEPAFRGRGIATRLNEDALLWLKAEGIQMVRLFASSTGRPLYEKLGFVPADEMVLRFSA